MVLGSKQAIWVFISLQCHDFSHFSGIDTGVVLSFDLSGKLFEGLRGVEGLWYFSISFRNVRGKRSLLELDELISFCLIEERNVGVSNNSTGRAR